MRQPQGKALPGPPFGQPPKGGTSQEQWPEWDGLPPHTFSAKGVYAAPARQLLQRLKKAYPGVGFSLAWDAQRLHVSVHGVTEGAMQSSPGPGDPLTRNEPNMWRGVEKLALSTPSPPTAELWVSVGPGSERSKWWGSERFYGIHTPRPQPAP